MDGIFKTEILPTMPALIGSQEEALHLFNFERRVQMASRNSDVYRVSFSSTIGSLDVSREREKNQGLDNPLDNVVIPEFTEFLNFRLIQIEISKFCRNPNNMTV